MWAIASHLYTIAGFLLALLLIARLMREKRNPGSTIAWLLAILLIPYIGIPFYFLFGGTRTKWMTNKKGQLYPSLNDADTFTKSYHYNTEHILVKSGAPPAANGNKIELLSNGRAAYSRLMESLESAEHSIDITTFILGHDKVGSAIVEKLAKKAGQGVKVRLILDSLGCLRTKGKFVEPLRRAGGRVGVFMPMLPLHKKWSANLRNHRKIAIVDRCTAIIGGMNLASEYMGPDFGESGWHDFNIMVKGPLVSYICQIFDADWGFATGEKSEIPPWTFDPGSASMFEEDVLAQIAASGPDAPTESFSDAIMTAILEAKERVWVITPYFIPDEPLLKSLSLLSKWGRDVRIIVPARSNHILADLARGSYMRTLFESGVKIYFFHAGMLHSKIILIDHSIAVVGSANIDMRSLYMNYEISLFLYTSLYIDAIAQVVERDVLSHSRLMEYRKKTFKNEVTELTEDVTRVLSPFL